MPSPIQVIAFLTCDGIHVDPASGKHTILGTFSSIRAARFPSVHPRMIWFLTITDVPVGKHQLRMSIGLPTESMKTVVDRSFESRSPGHRINLINDIHQLRFKTAGDYTITIEVDDQTLMVTTLSVTA